MIHLNTFGRLRPNFSIANGKILVGDASSKPVETDLSSIPLSSFAAPVGNIAFGGFKITGLAAPDDGGDAVNKTYADGLVAGSFSAGQGIVKDGSTIHFASSSSYNDGALFYASGTAAVGQLSIGAANRFLFAEGGAQPSWSAYSMPSPAVPLTANRLFYSSSTTQVSTLSTTASSVLTSSAGGALQWTAFNPARGVLGVAQKYSQKVAGDGVNSYITVNHGLNSVDVTYSVRFSASSESLPYEFADCRVEVIDANNIRLHFWTVQTAVDYYVATVIG